MGRFSRLETGTSAPPREQAASAGNEAPANEAHPEPDAAGYIELGDRALFGDEPRAALRWYSKALDLDGTRLEAWTRMIMAQLLGGKRGEADSWIGRALAAFPGEPALLALRGVEQAHQGLRKQALASCDAALERAGEDPLVHVARGQALLLAGSGNAFHCFNQSVKLAPQDEWKTPMLVGLILRRQRIRVKAIGYFMQAAERNEREPLIWYQVGLCRAEMGRRRQALHALATARELCPPEDPLLARIERASTGSFWRWLMVMLRLGG